MYWYQINENSTCLPKSSSNSSSQKQSFIIFMELSVISFLESNNRYRANVSKMGFLKTKITVVSGP